MQSNTGSSLFGNSSTDARFLEIIQDPSKRQERLKVLERRRTINTWSLWLYGGLLLVMAVIGLASSNLSLSLLLMALTIAMAASAAVRLADVDTEIKLIKLYVLLTQNSNRAT